MMRRALHELTRIRSLSERDTAEVHNLRERVRKALIELERDARAEVGRFTPLDMGKELRLDLTHKFRNELPGPQTPEAPPSTFEEARNEWAALAGPTEQQVRDLSRARAVWDQKTVKRQRSKPSVPPELWQSTERLSEIHAALPALRERFVSDRLASQGHLNGDLANEIRKRSARLNQEFEAARGLLEQLEEAAGVTGSTWAHPGWIHASPALEIRRVIRIGEFDPGLPPAAQIGPVPALLDFPFQAGVAIATDVDHRASAIDLARALVLRALAATPAGDVRFVFIDPVSLGQGVADFRHLAEFDQRLVDTKTWTSERDIESRLEEMSDHLEVVISTYLRGQFESIDEYNRQAGEVAEPYRILVIFDYPTGFTARSARQLLSLIENGTRCGVHVVLVYDPSHKPVDEVPFERLVHSMQRIDLTTIRGVTLPEPIGSVDLDFLPDASPTISFSPEGRATSPFAQLLLNIGDGARTSQSGPVTLERIVPVINRQIASGRSRQLPQRSPGSVELDVGNKDTWWTSTTADGAYAPIGRAGAQDVAAMYFSSTEIAGGAIVVGLPRAGKSTALHAAIVSMSMLYSPDELELYLVDSKHGVEFKVYEQLPHARLVSINSEREFSVSVLQSLDGEIKRRAELMKRHAAGKANITEYRLATGERLPRIVLFMDEFHELFEEDDAAGQAAFQAFSNIVRQGPFAGVHAVVASQTLSSMPAMDRGTLSLLPMRIAFMCNEADADLVMGDANREVRALSQQGEGILNASRGEPSHNKPFRGLYVPSEERAVLLQTMAAQAAALGFSRKPRVFDGDRLAERPNAPSPGTKTRPEFALGEPFTLEPWAGVRLRRGRGANLLLLGAADDDRANRDSAIDAACQSCIVEATVQGLVVQLVDFVGDFEPVGDALDLIGLSEALGASYRRGSALASVLADATREVTLRRQNEDYKAGAHLLVLNGLHRALDLAPDDPYADTDDIDQPNAARLLADLLRDGPEVGCHTAVVVESIAQFDRRLGRDSLKEFDWRIAGSEVSPPDIAVITESYTETEVRPSQLLLADHGRGKRQRVRAYPSHTSTSVRTSTERNRK
jgi:hypothetical protein